MAQSQNKTSVLPQQESNPVLRGGLRKWPRQYAQEIIDEPERAERRKMLEKVPEPLKAWVKFYVTDYFERKVK